MIIPAFLSKGDIIGVTASSCGVLDKIDKYEKSIAVVQEQGFSIIETNNVRTSGMVSSDAVTRARELESLFLNPDVKAVAIASGGDFLYDMLTEIDYSILRKHVKWLCGSSDPTSLLFLITTNYDIATIYSPCNMGGFTITPLHPFYLQYFEILKGNFVKQEKFPYCESKGFTDVLDQKNQWINIHGDVDAFGVLIGGCLEALKDIIGTKFDKTTAFLSKYQKEGILWYFDIFSMTSENVYITLLQFKNAGWFSCTNAILIGKVCFPNTFVGFSYEEAIRKALSDIPVVYQFDLGHVKPSFTIINGMKAHVISNDKEGSLEYICKNSCL